MYLDAFTVLPPLNFAIDAGYTRHDLLQHERKHQCYDNGILDLLCHQFDYRLQISVLHHQPTDNSLGNLLLFTKKSKKGMIQ